MSNCNDTIAGLDLRPLATLRAPAAAAKRALRRGDRSPLLIAAAKALLDQERAILGEAQLALISIGVDIDDIEIADTLSNTVSDIGTEDLGYWLDVAEGRVQ